MSEIADEDQLYCHANRRPKPGRAPYYYAIAGVVVVAIWIALTVHSNFRGDWTALFHVGSRTEWPPELRNDKPYRVASSGGYDGQYYLLVAHDPLLRKGFGRFVDNPSLRWRRILIPALASIAVLGDSERIASAYLGIQLLFVGLGVYFLSKYSLTYSLPADWGLLFLLVPAVLISIDRMTTDLGLAAMCAGFALYARGDASIHPEKKLWAVLAVAPLIRETGLCLIAGYVIWALLRRLWKRAILMSSAAFPAMCWFAYIASKTAADQTTWTGVPFAGLLARTLQPFPMQAASTWVKLAYALDYLAIIGIWIAIGLVTHLLFQQGWGPIEIATLSFTLVAAALSKADIWLDAYAFGRTQTPLLFMLALLSLPYRFWLGLLPMILVVLRVLYTLLPQALGILRSAMAFRV